MNVRVIGEIDTPGGSYVIMWNDQIQLKQGNCPSGSVKVNDTFKVPAVTEGAHYITLWDISNYNNYPSSDPVQFSVILSPSYAASVEPTRIQEGLYTIITVCIRGAAAISSYILPVVVTTPTGTPYTADFTLATGGSGNGTAKKLYWAEFPGANTNLVGTYNVSVNGSLATKNFTVGLTDKLIYLTTETANIRGAGYLPNENVIADLKFSGKSVSGYPKNMIADTNGIVNDSWNILIDATTGIYTITLVSASTLGTVKLPADVQEFSVRLAYQIQTRNLVNEPVANVTVEVYNTDASNLIISQKTNQTGWAIFFLEKGNYALKTFWKDVEVGSIPNQNVSRTLTRILDVHLTKIRTVVKDEGNAALVLVNVTLTYNYTTRYGVRLLGTVPLVTNSTGIAELHNTLSNISYAVETRRYGHLFNRTFIQNLTSSLEVNITCPSYNLFINVVDSKELQARNIQVVVYEPSSGSSIGAPKVTSSSGSTSFRLSLGRYKVSVFNYSVELGSDVVLNESTIDLIEDRFFLVHCRILNVDLSIRVVDYFGQLMPNAAVEVERYGVKIGAAQKIGSDGVILLQKVIGGDYRISVYLGGTLAGIQTFHVDRSMEILFRLGGYVVIGGYPLGISQLITLISISLVSISLVLLKVRKRLLLFVRKIG
ncbi:MAG: hypothetical protein V1850_02130 [Candidatus Bathyarchaeota archaeon]